MNRHLIFKNYWWIAALVGGAAALASFLFGGEDRIGLIGASIAGTLGFCYFVQEQKLWGTIAAVTYNVMGGFKSIVSAEAARAAIEAQDAFATQCALQSLLR